MPDSTIDPLDGNSAGRKIPKAELLQMARAYRDQRLALITEYGNNPNDSRSCYYSRDVLEAILASGCEGIRIYYGVRVEPSDGKHYTTLMLVGVRVNATTGLEEIVKITDGEEEVLYEWGQLSPPDKDTEIPDNALLQEIDEE